MVILFSQMLCGMIDAQIPYLYTPKKVLWYMVFPVQEDPIWLP